VPMCFAFDYRRNGLTLAEKCARWAHKSWPDIWAAIRATLRNVPRQYVEVRALMRRRVTFRGRYAPPRVLQGHEQFYMAYRPDWDVEFLRYPEMERLSHKWILNNVENNAGDLPRFYALILNVRRILEDNVQGDMAELGVYRGNSAAVLAHYARAAGKTLLLFDTFTGFDRRDLPE
jgi:hypothetical protein